MVKAPLGLKVQRSGFPKKKKWIWPTKYPESSFFYLEISGACLCFSMFFLRLGYTFKCGPFYSHGLHLLFFLALHLPFILARSGNTPITIAAQNRDMDKVAPVISWCRFTPWILQCEAPKISKLVHITPITLVYGTQITIVFLGRF